MATAGELVIKIAADYAQLVTGMGEVNAKVDQFGRNVNAQTNAMQRGFAMAATAAKAFVGALAVNEILAYGQSLEKLLGDMADMADNLKMTVDEFQAFQGAALLAGQSTDAVAAAIGKFNVFIGKAAAGGKEQIETLNELGIKILDVNGNVRKQADLQAEAAQKITGLTNAATRARIEVELFGKSGQAISATLEQWKKGSEELNRELEAQGLRHLPETIKRMDDMSDRAAIGAKKLEVFFAPFYAAAKFKLIEHFSELLQSFASDLDAIGAHGNIIDKIIALLQAFGKDGSTASAKQFSTEQYAKSIDTLTKSIEHLEKAEANLANNTREGTTNPALENVRRRLDDDRALLLALQSRGQTPGNITGASQGTRPTPGTSNPGVKGAGEAVADELEKLRQAQFSAQAAMDQMSKSTLATFEEARREAELSKAIADKTADLWLKAQKTGGATLEQINNQVSATLRAQDALKRYEQDAQKADEATRRLGDGTEEYAKAMEDLNRQFATGRLSQIAYDRAAANAAERMKDQAAELDRFKGGLEGFSAGVEKAARDYAKANDEFAMGGRVFTGFISAIDQGLDALTGTSNKTFGQIAADFARMLADMGLRAALSPVFKWLMKGLSGGGGIDAEIADWSSYGSGGGGGGSWLSGIGSWLGGIFGGGMAIGGEVQAGVTYQVGEHGPEKFTPRGAGTITPAGDGLKIIVNNNAPGVEVTARKTPAGTELTIEKVRAALSRDIRRGGNIFASSMEQAYGVARGGGAT